MDFLLLALALLLLLMAGLGTSLMVLPKEHRVGTSELFGLSFLLGSAVVSALSFVLGFALSGALLRGTVAALCVLLCLSSLRWRGWRIKSREVFPADGIGWLLLALGLLQTGVVAWLCFWRVLGWDGLFNFESKARLAFLNGGVIPLEFFSDPTRTWTLQSYPLLLPLTESWLYLWLGRADQELVKIIFVLFFAAALCLLHGGARSLGLSGWRMFVAPLALFTAPLLLIGDGSASSGYADFPLAVFYLAAVIWLMEFWRNGNGAALRVAGVLLAAACWLKQDGAILWLTAMMIVVIRTWFNGTDWRRWRTLAAAASPGAAVITGWQLFVRLNHSLNISQFSPPSLGTLRTNIWRAPAIVAAVGGELLNWRHWSVFWLLGLIATVILWQSKSRELRWLPLLVLLPLVFYSGIYMFSLWPSFLTHLESSFPRLLIHTSLVGALLIGEALRKRQRLSGPTYT
ncbi:MAG: hypothetical protein M3X11_02595 [Acidobacteriota bacterium]|nr:hypothetical protein [Acidobacteriota bacterium]